MTATPQDQAWKDIAMPESFCQVADNRHSESCPAKDVGRVTPVDGAGAVPAGRGSSPPLPGG